MNNEKKNLVFTVTHGRTGTTMLTETFKIFNDVRSEHEPHPNYADVFQSVKLDPRHALLFLEKKLDSIYASRESSYVETSNVFGKGFLIPLLRMGVMPGLIFLNRDFRETAKSLYKRGSTPARSDNGKRYSADPTLPGALPVFSPMTLSDYQLCFWGVLDAFYRQLQAQSIYDSEGGVYCWVTAEDFHDYENVIRIGAKFGLEVDDEEAARKKHAEVVAFHHNPNKGGRDTSGLSFLDEEIEVVDRVSFYAPEFAETVLRSRFVDSKLSSSFFSGSAS
ncbi:hypothetical protein [Halomonas koreensis]|uniref:Sulfotransferase family protein n=1 Tax=Halomonas koreensis TaxID=245385 RepID=A0ABU1G1U9_9GAMM|nr:hypothetical protein [Halomonas koreensis]MDR5866923.1 hypothetical protein [Halomonas koreensis]